MERKKRIRHIAELIIEPPTIKNIGNNAPKKTFTEKSELINDSYVIRSYGKDGKSEMFTETPERVSQSPVIMTNEAMTKSFTKNAERLSSAIEGYTNVGFEIDEGHHDSTETRKTSLSMDTGTSLLEHDPSKHNQVTEDDSHRSPEPLEPRPPDGGWGWVVCFAAFVETLIFDGVFYSFGIIFLELTDHFESKKETGAWISSVNLGVCMTIGPLVSALTNKFGFRAVTIVGSWLTAFGMLLSSFATSIPYLYISYGLIAGFGYGMVYSPSILAVTLYFDKKRSLATGLALCGNGLGVFIMSPITEWLLQMYSWRGTFLVHAGLLLHGITCGLVFRPLSEYTDNNKDTTDVPSEDISRRSMKDNINQPLFENDISKDVVEYQLGSDKTGDMLTETESEKKNSKDIFKYLPKDTLYENSVIDIGWNGNVTDDIVIEKQSSGSIRRPHRPCSESSKTPARHKSFCVLNNIRNILYQTFDLSLLRHVPFCLYTISSALYSLSYYVPFIYIPDVAKQAGIGSSKGAWLVSSIGVSNIVSRVLFGSFIDRPRINRVHCYSVAVFLAGIVVGLVPLITSYEILLCICIAFGLFQGLSAVLMTVLIADLLGTKDTTQGFGILNLFSGIATIVGPPFAGWLFDLTGKFDLSFYVCGIIVSVSGAMLFIFPCLKRRELG